jgi:hypothetical protein
VDEQTARELAAKRVKWLEAFASLMDESYALHETDPDLAASLPDLEGSEPASWPALACMARALASAERAGVEGRPRSEVGLAVLGDEVRGLLDPATPLAHRIALYDRAFAAAVVAGS